MVLGHAKRDRSRFVVLPVALAEKIARVLADDLYTVPKIDGCQIASNRAPPFASNIDPSRVMEWTYPCSAKEGPTAGAARGQGRWRRRPWEVACVPTWISPGEGLGEGLISCGF